MTTKTVEKPFKFRKESTLQRNERCKHVEFKGISTEKLRRLIYFDDRKSIGNGFQKNNLEFQRQHSNWFQQKCMGDKNINWIEQRRILDR